MTLTLDDYEGHWQPILSVILATAGLLLHFHFCLLMATHLILIFSSVKFKC